MRGKSGDRVDRRGAKVVTPPLIAISYLQLLNLRKPVEMRGSKPRPAFTEHGLESSRSEQAAANDHLLTFHVLADFVGVVETPFVATATSGFGSAQVTHRLSFSTASRTASSLQTPFPTKRKI